MRRLYFAHPISDYGTALEDQWLELLPTLAQGRWDVVNPNELQHQEGCKGVGMPYFEAVVRGCDAVAFLAFEDGAIGAGVAKEIDVLRTSHPAAPVFELGRDGQTFAPVDAWPGDRRLLTVLVSHPTAPTHGSIPLARVWVAPRGA